MKTKQIIGLVVAIVLIVVTSCFGLLFATFSNNLLSSSDISFDNGETARSGSYIGAINITGVIGEPSEISLFGSEIYDTSFILNQISAMTNDTNNKALLLYVDSPGGYVYDSDLIYEQLKYYKATGKPIYAYFGSSACSGAYYVAAVADKIYSQRTCNIGSIGVYIEITDTTEMEKQQGINRIYITSGDNKVLDIVDGNIAEEQRAMYQEIVDNAYNNFIDIIVEGRGISREKALEIGDGSVFTAPKSLELGLIDEIATYQDAMNSIFADIGVSSLEIYYPEPDRGFWSFLSAAVDKLDSRSESEVLLDYIDEHRKGELMYYAV